MTAYLLNLFDLVCTYILLSHGGEEINPVARWLINIHPAAFPFAKIVVAGVLCWLMVRIAKVEPTARYALWLITGYYAAIAVYYIVIFAAMVAA